MGLGTRSGAGSRGSGLGHSWVAAGVRGGTAREEGSRLGKRGRVPPADVRRDDRMGSGSALPPGLRLRPDGDPGPGADDAGRGLTWRSGRGGAAQRGEGAATGSRAAVGPALRPPPSCSMPSQSPAPRPAHWCWGRPRGPRSPPPGLCAPRPERGRSPARTREGIPRRHPRPAPLPDPQEKTDWSAGAGTP